MESPPHPALHRPIHRFGLRTTLIAAGVLVAVVPLAELIVLITTGWAPLHTLDLNIVHSVNRYAAHHSGQVQFWKIVSIISGPTVLRIAAFLAVVLLWVRRRRAAAILVAVAIGGAAALSGIFKVLVNRGRPVVAYRSSMRTIRERSRCVAARFCGWAGTTVMCCSKICR